MDGAVGCESQFPTVTVEIRLAASGDEQLIQAGTAVVFDHIPRADLTTEFLRDPRHHLVVAIADGRIVGFVSAVDYVHPDKSAELWINEVGVAGSHRGRGIGKAIMAAMLEVAKDLGCREAWVLTDRGNEPAMRLYAAAGGKPTPRDQVMFTFKFS